MVEDRQTVGVRHGPYGLTHPLAERLALLLQTGEVRLVGVPLPLQEAAQPQDRVLGPPGLRLLVGAVLGRVVGRGVGAHPVRERLDQHRPLAPARPLQRGAGHRQTGQDVVAVDPDAGEAVPLRALVERHPHLLLGGLGDRPLVVLAEEDDRGVVDRGEGERLRDVALAGGAVAEVGDHGAVGAVLRHPHGVTDGVQGLRADDDRVQVEVVGARVPATVVHAAEHAEQVGRVDSPDPGHPVLTVGGEDVVVVVQGAARADLGGLLPQQRRPQPEPLPGAGARWPRRRSAGSAPCPGTGPAAPRGSGRSRIPGAPRAHPQG